MIQYYFFSYTNKFNYNFNIIGYFKNIKEDVIVGVNEKDTAEVLNKYKNFKIYIDEQVCEKYGLLVLLKLFYNYNYHINNIRYLREIPLLKNFSNFIRDDNNIIVIKNPNYLDIVENLYNFDINNFFKSSEYKNSKMQEIRKRLNFCNKYIRKNYYLIEKFNKEGNLVKIYKKKEHKTK